MACFIQLQQSCQGNMAEDRQETSSENSVCSPGSTSPMSTKYRYMFDRLCSFATSWKKSSTPTGRRIFHRDVEKEEFQYASSHCLSSYYSVFVVRLAIMVSEIFPNMVKLWSLCLVFACTCSLIYMQKYIMKPRLNCQEKLRISCEEKTNHQTLVYI